MPMTRNQAGSSFGGEEHALQQLLHVEALKGAARRPDPPPPRVAWEQPFNEQIDEADNKSAQILAKNPVFHERSKYIDTWYHFIRECIVKKEVEPSLKILEE
ncbi:hypothetical protein CR513_14050, partial [Mucuna pruriens]